MKYYIYISDTKVDMLYPQIPKSLLKKIASSLNIDLKLLGAEVNLGAKTISTDETRYSKVKIVSEYIEKHLDVGTIDTPSTYFKGKLLMQWGQIELPADKAVLSLTRTEDYFNNISSDVYFAGKTERTYLGLCGSLKHVLGTPTEAINKVNLNPYGSSSLIGFRLMLEQLYANNPPLPENKQRTDREDEEWVNWIFSATQNMRGPKQQLEFLAKTLLQVNTANENAGNVPVYRQHVVLGTPIYVAIAD
jgi:hypothetical protein